MLNHQHPQSIIHSWKWRIIVFNVMLVWFSMIFENIYVCIHQGYWPIVLFSNIVFVRQCYQDNAGLENKHGCVPFSSAFWRVLRRIDINSLIVWNNLLMKPSDAEIFFTKRFLVTGSISLLIIRLFRFLFVSNSFLVGCF